MAAADSAAGVDRDWMMPAETDSSQSGPSSSAAAAGCSPADSDRHGGGDPTARDSRDCYSDAPPSPFGRCFNMDGEGMPVVDSLADG